MPFPKPGSHTSILNESSLLENTLSSAIIQNITESLEETIKTKIPAIDMANIENRLESLSKEISNFKELAKPLPPLQGSLRSDPFLESPPIPPLERRVLSCPEEPFERYQEDYLSTDELDSLEDLLGYLKSSADYVPEKGHSVKLYGEPYNYTGCRSSVTDPIPEELRKIIDKLSADLSLSDRPNSVLINYYPESSRLQFNDSYLAMHSDDESSILPDSKILTLSIGASRKVVFQSKHSGSEVQTTELTTNNNSLYVMTRTSQNWFKHGVPAPDAEDFDERFSVTFRSLRHQYKRSMLVVGDSNTKEIQFGSGSGKVGKSFPGKRIKASKVANIDPSSCTGYANVFLMCGTNDMRCDNIKSKSDIQAVVDQLKDKLSEIKQLCPSTKLFVIPVMPSRIRQMNANIELYNELVDHMLMVNFPDIWFEGIYSFLDHQDMLSAKLTRENDKIHLNVKGISKLVTYMKSCVFNREKYESSNFMSTSIYQGSAHQVGSPEPT